jgi:hypothetical protein
LSNSPFIKPRYDGHCFANLPATLHYWLTGQGQPALAPEHIGRFAKQYDTVIFMFIDAFGWRFFEPYRDQFPFLQQFSQASKITAQFPSTTTAHVTCIHTGQAVGQSGLYEWHMYDPTVDDMITPFMFSFSGDKLAETLKPLHFQPADLYPPPTTFYQTLAQCGIHSTVLQHKALSRSTYSQYVLRGVSEIITHKTLPEAMVNLRLALAKQSRPSYYFFYYAMLDTICHDYGPESPQLAAEIENFLMTMAQIFYQPLHGKMKNSLLVLTADHGQVAIDPKTTLYLNLDPRFVGLEDFIQSNRQGRKLVPAGSPRDMFFHIQADKLAEAQAFLAPRLAGRAEVCLVADLIEQGYFGLQPISSVFLQRVGNLVILPYEHESVWWYEAERFEQLFYGHHGGLTAAEMEIPVLLSDFS